jgi:N-acyl-D-aspartate/D-glutamate deacylase
MHDLLFRGARVIDGSGSPARLADVVVDAGLIAEIRDAEDPGRPADARQVVACDGLVLAPGFIDVHTHDDALMLERAPLDRAHPKLSQGVTTVVTGNCGISLAPLDASAVRDLPAQPPVCNVAALVGHTSLRVKHLPDLGREATEAQAEAMASDVGAALRQGAWGLSTGVFRRACPPNWCSA